MTRRQRLRRGSERGFTVVEMITCIVVLGLVMVPLSLAVNQTLTQLPDNTARTQQSNESQRAVTLFTDDMTNATTTDLFKLYTPYGAKTITCGQTTPPLVALLQWTDANAVLQNSIWLINFGTPAGTAVPVNLIRWSNGPPVVDTVFRGYCVKPPTGPAPPVVTITRTAAKCEPAPAGAGTTTTTVANCVASNAEHVRMTLFTASKPGGPVTTVNFEAIRRNP
ncbi:MAG: type II secretion system protein [Actinomycetota bacterium]